MAHKNAGFCRVKRYKQRQACNTRQVLVLPEAGLELTASLWCCSVEHKQVHRTSIEDKDTVTMID